MLTLLKMLIGAEGEVGMMAQLLKICVAPAEVLGLVTSTQGVAHNHL